MDGAGASYHPPIHLPGAETLHMTEWQHDLDATGLLCPLPALKAKRALNAMQPGEVLRVRATDPKAPEDLALLCAQSGNELVEAACEGEVHVVYLRRR